MNVKDILVEWLKEHGYDGLCNNMDGCGCDMKDICPWTDQKIENCESAYKVPADADFKAIWGDDAEWMYITKKRQPTDGLAALDGIAALAKEEDKS